MLQKPEHIQRVINMHQEKGSGVLDPDMLGIVSDGVNDDNASYRLRAVFHLVAEAENKMIKRDEKEMARLTGTDIEKIYLAEETRSLLEPKNELPYVSQFTDIFHKAFFSPAVKMKLALLQELGIQCSTNLKILTNSSEFQSIELSFLQVLKKYSSYLKLPENDSSILSFLSKFSKLSDEDMELYFDLNSERPVLLESVLDFTVKYKKRLSLIKKLKEKDPFEYIYLLSQLTDNISDKERMPKTVLSRKDEWMMRNTLLRVFSPKLKGQIQPFEDGFISVMRDAQKFGNFLNSSAATREFVLKHFREFGFIINPFIISPCALHNLQMSFESNEFLENFHGIDEVSDGGKMQKMILLAFGQYFPPNVRVEDSFEALDRLLQISSFEEKLEIYLALNCFLSNPEVKKDDIYFSRAMQLLSDLNGQLEKTPEYLKDSFDPLFEYINNCSNQTKISSPTCNKILWVLGGVIGSSTDEIFLSKLKDFLEVFKHKLGGEHPLVSMLLMMNKNLRKFILKDDGVQADLSKEIQLNRLNESFVNSLFEINLNHSLKEGILEVFSPVFKSEFDIDLEMFLKPFSNLQNLTFGTVISVMKSIERKCKGSSKILFEKYGIREFNRYPEELLLNQLANENKNIPYGVVFYPRDDHNGAFDHNKDQFSSLYNQLSPHDFGIRIFEVDGRVSIVKALVSLNKQYGEKNKISFVIIGGHGTENTISFGDWEEQRVTLSAESVRNSVGILKLKDFFVEKPTLIAISCSTGVPEGIVNEFSRKVPDAVCIGPKIPANWKDVTVQFDSDNQPQFTIEYYKDGEGSTYRQAMRH